MDLLVLEGDGIGPEITAATVAVLTAAADRWGLPLRLSRAEIGFAALAQHGAAPDIAGQDRANPASLIGSAAMLLRHLGATEAARAIDLSLDAALTRPETRTRDLGGVLGTATFGAAVARMILET